MTPGEGAPMLEGTSALGLSTSRNWRAVTGAKLTVVGTLSAGTSATLRQVMPSVLASSTGLTVTPANITLAWPMNTCADRTVCATGHERTTVAGVPSAGCATDTALSRLLPVRIAASSGWPAPVLAVGRGSAPSCVGTANAAISPYNCGGGGAWGSSPMPGCIDSD